LAAINPKKHGEAMFSALSTITFLCAVAGMSHQISQRRGVLKMTLAATP
jgi:hypothetical protein